MKFDTPAGQNPIDRLKVVGQPTDRIDGKYKTTGTAPYAYERHDAAPNAATVSNNARETLFMMFPPALTEHSAPKTRTPG